MAITRDNSGAALTGGGKVGSAGKLKIVSPCCLEGQHVPAGTIVELDPIAARRLIASGRAVPYAGEPEKPATKTPEPTAKKAPARKRAVKKG
jgi:hypothetical protein